MPQLLVVLFRVYQHFLDPLDIVPIEGLTSVFAPPTVSLEVEGHGVFVQLSFKLPFLSHPLFMVISRTLARVSLTDMAAQGSTLPELFLAELALVLAVPPSDYLFAFIFFKG